MRVVPGIPVKKPIRKYAHGRIFGKRATKYGAQGVFYISLSRAVTGVNREVIKQSFKLCGISPKGLVPVEHLNARLRGILGYQEGLEVVQQYDPFEDEGGDEFDSEYFRISIPVFCDS